ncbi:MAG: lysine--tRNA ligase, partial [Patescibacteria group bacterium]
LLRKAGKDPYPAKSWRTHDIGQVLGDFDAFAGERRHVVIVGRVMAVREHGGATFFDIEDATGRMQALIRKDTLGDHEYDFFQQTTDIGDFVEVGGVPFLTKKNEKTVEGDKYRMLTKSLLPLPEKWHGLQDAEDRFRKRYLDFIFNPDVRRKIELRTKVVQALRAFLDEQGFLEVETPTLQTVAGGANARPFQTKLNTLNLDVYLRIAPELFLKRLLVGGFEKVYEFARNFRNEGIDRDHNPEFSELEFYIAYKDYEWLMAFTEKMLEQVVRQARGSTTVRYKNQDIDFKGPYIRVTFNDLLEKHSGLNYDVADEDTLAAKAKELGITIEKAMTKGNIADEIYKKVARPLIIQPIFVINHPLDISPLSKKLEGDDQHVARFQLLVAGNEIINAFSELNDPLDQRERFEAQRAVAKRGSQETHPFDEDFVEALEYGMPPAAGWGLGIDRLVAILTDSHSIREVIAFPLMKPKD